MVAGRRRYSNAFPSAVFIAQKFEGKGADRKAVPRTPEEMQKLRRIVQSALGIQENGDADRKDDITLEEMPFNDQAADGVDAAIGPTGANGSSGWTSRKK